MKKRAEKALFLRLFSGIDLPPRAPHRPDGAVLPQVHAPLQPLRRGQGMGLRQGVVRQDDGVEGVPGDEAGLLSEIRRAGGGA